MLRVEFHTHTIYSKDSLSRPDDLIKAARKKNLDRIVVTDHNEIEGARIAKSLDPELVIIGEEIMTTEGELLAAFVKEKIPEGLSSLEAIQRLREQDAFISVSHPYDRWRNGHWTTDDLLGICPLVDAIEIFNARCMLPSFNRLAMDFARRNHLPGTAGSDAHALFEIGRAIMLLPDFDDAITLKQGLASAQYETKLSSPWVHFSSRYAVWRKKFGIGEKLQSLP